jgi:hypothetical protein
MDDIDQDQSRMMFVFSHKNIFEFRSFKDYRTPMLTPHTSEVTTLQEYLDSEVIFFSSFYPTKKIIFSSTQVPFSSGDHQQAMNDLSSDLEQINISFNYQSSNNNCTYINLRNFPYEILKSF